jgi:hypothetical protein
VGGHGPGTVCDRHGLKDEARTSNHRPMEGCGSSLEAGRQLMRVGAGNAEENRGVA